LYVGIVGLKGSYHIIINQHHNLIHY